jgi:hypothetical protein
LPQNLVAEAEGERHHEEVVDGRDAELPAGDVEGIHAGLLFYVV